MHLTDRKEEHMWAIRIEKTWNVYSEPANVNLQTCLHYYLRRTRRSQKMATSIKCHEHYQQLAVREKRSVWSPRISVGKYVINRTGPFFVNYCTRKMSLPLIIPSFEFSDLFVVGPSFNPLLKLLGECVATIGYLILAAHLFSNLWAKVSIPHNYALLLNLFLDIYLDSAIFATPLQDCQFNEACIKQLYVL